MQNEYAKRVGENLFRVVKQKFRSNAAFEREAGLPAKTMNNWQRGRSASYLKILPQLADVLGVPLVVLTAVQPEDGETLTDHELELLRIYRSLLPLSEEKRDRFVRSIAELASLLVAE